ncbi:MAG: radical SAM protein [Chloroflexi bacterium]|nr:radical SAM protein [Chloroflexota bacterium]
MNERLSQFAEHFIASTREYIFIRPEDRLLILRPNKTYHLNATATEMLHALYTRERVDADAVVREIAARYHAPLEQIENDLDKLLDSLRWMLQNKPTRGAAVRRTPFGSHAIKFPVLSEIALTYRCNNRCTFCYASAPDRAHDLPEMTTDEIKRIIDKIVTQAKVPTISFTGGEPTLHRDLPDLIAYAKSKQMRVNLITNGTRCANAEFVAELKRAGLDSAQVSLEAADEAVHNRIVANPRAYTQTVQGIRNLKAAGIHTHTNTTINQHNRDHLRGLIDFLAALGQEYLSMNMVIRTGNAVARKNSEFKIKNSDALPKAEGGFQNSKFDIQDSDARSNHEFRISNLEIGYRDIGQLVLELKKHSETRGLRFVWYSPVPYCLFNPAQHGLGSQSCAAADGLLSINPAGDVLPCSSFEQGIGNLLRDDFDAIWQTRTARYWRRKEFLPPDCRGCEMANLCCGACPLYWDEVGSFAEIENATPRRAPAWENAIWQAKRRWIGQVKGMGVS